MAQQSEHDSYLVAGVQGRQQHCSTSRRTVDAPKLTVQDL